MVRPRSAVLVRQFTDFLDEDSGAGSRMSRVHALRDSSSRRLVVSIDELRSADESLAYQLTTNPLEYLPAFDAALQEILKSSRPDLAEDEDLLRRHRIGLEGSFGALRVSPRGLLSKLVGSMVQVEGIVTRASLVRPKLLKSTHYSKTTKKMLVKEYGDGSMSSGIETVFGAPSAYLTHDKEGHELETEYGMCEYLDNQRIVLQEMPENSPPGQLPRSIDIIAEDDLVDGCKPGDRIRVVGVFRALGGTTTAQGSGVFKTIINANSIRLLREDSTAFVKITEGDTKNIRSMGQRRDVYKTLASSIAPSIYGHNIIKKAILLLLLGGNEKNIKNGTHLRGDINMLMIGDPSTAKSQLLRFVMHLAPLAVSTTGRGSSGVGLTAAVTNDPDTGERHLEAGAMVLADRGVVCIDEFDKMTDEDRVAIHEVMEQQTVTIAKAGIHCSLNARCSVIAAANPVYGSYDTRKTTYENSALPDSLLSRFDVIFTVLDRMDETLDSRIAEHVLRAHQFRRPGYDVDVAAPMEDFAEEEDNANRNEDGTTPVYDRNAKKLFMLSGRKSRKILTVEFLRKFIHFAKTKFRPVLTEAAAEFIALKYKDLRVRFLNSSTKTLPITARCLETLIRLATAHAKCRLSLQVTEKDAEEAFSILNFALTNQLANAHSRRRSEKRKRREELDSGNDTGDDDATPRPPRMRRAAGRGERMPGSSTTPSKQSVEKQAAPLDAGVPQSDQNGRDVEESAGTTQTVTPRSLPSRTGRSSRQRSVEAADEVEDEDEEFQAPAPPSPKPPAVEVNPESVQTVLAAFNHLTSNTDVCSISDVKKELGSGVSSAELKVILEKLAADEKVFLHDDNLFRI